MITHCLWCTCSRQAEKNISFKLSKGDCKWENKTSSFIYLSESVILAVSSDLYIHSSIVYTIFNTRPFKCLNEMILTYFMVRFVGDKGDQNSKVLHLALSWSKTGQNLSLKRGCLVVEFNKPNASEQSTALKHTCQLLKYFGFMIIFVY